MRGNPKTSRWPGSRQRSLQRRTDALLLFGEKDLVIAAQGTQVALAELARLGPTVQYADQRVSRERFFPSQRVHLFPQSQQVIVVPMDEPRVQGRHEGQQNQDDQADRYAEP